MRPQMPNENYYYHNVPKHECTINTIIDPDNKNFENALLFWKGLPTTVLKERLSDLSI